MTVPKQSRIVHPGTFASAIATAPGDRSISQRFALIAGISTGTSVIRGFRATEECLGTLSAMESLGARSVLDSDGVLSIQGTGGRFLEPAGPLNVGSSLTAMRLLAGLCSGAPVSVTLVGDDELNAHRMDRIRDPLRLMGADVTLSAEETPPIRIRGGGLHGIHYEPSYGGAQVKSCCILAGLYATGRTTVVEPVPTRDHTEKILSALGAPISVDGATISIEGYGPEGPKFAARDYFVPGNFSGAAYWLSAAAMTPGCTVRVEGVGLNPRRTALLDVLRRMGAAVSVTVTSPADAVELYGDVEVTGPSSLVSTVVSGDEIHNLIDEIPLVAVLASRAHGTTVVRDLHREILMVHAILDDLNRLAIPAEPRADGFSVTGPAAPKASKGPEMTALRSYGDARVAMAMSLLASFAETPVLVANVGCVDAYYPEFWQQLSTLGVPLE